MKIEERKMYDGEDIDTMKSELKARYARMPSEIEHDVLDALMLNTALWRVESYEGEDMDTILLRITRRTQCDEG